MRLKRKVLFPIGCAIAVLAFLGVALLFAAPVRVVASADNEASIGTNDIPRVSYSAEYVSAVQGVEITIQCVTVTERLEYTFDPDRVDTQDIPEEVLQGEIPLEYDETLQRLVGKITTYYNGEYTFTAYVNKGGDDLLPAVVDNVVINTIDWSPPVLNANRERISVKDGKLYYTIFVYDNVQAKTELTAASGLKDITVFYWDEKTVFPEDEMENIETFEQLQQAFGDVLGEVMRRTYDSTTSRRQYDELTFDISKTGVAYYVFTVDRVGNAGIERLFYRNYEEKLEVEWNGAKINVGELADLAEQEVEAYADTYNADLLSRLATAALKLRLTFLRDSFDEIDRIEAWQELASVQQEVLNATRELTVEVRNADLLGGKIEVNASVNAVKKEMKYGDTLVLEMTWALYTPARADRKAVAATGVSTPSGVWKLEYKLLWNGTPVAPDNPILLHVQWDQGYEDIGFSLQKGNDVSSLEAEYGGRWVELKLAQAEAIVWIAVDESGLTWLWITLGVLAGVVLIGAIVLLVLDRKGLLPKRKGKKAVKDSASATDADKSE